MVASAGVVIIGTGQAGFQVAASLREEGWEGAITLVGDEPGLPYQRPPLSKGLLSGKVGPEQIRLRPDAFFAEQRITLVDGQRAIQIDRSQRRVSLQSGTALEYAHLVLATGTRPKQLAIPGADLQGVMALRTLDDATRILERMGTARRIVIVGAGFVGLEVAVAALDRGLEVAIVEYADQVMQRAVCATTAGFFTEALEARGVRFRFKTGVRAISGKNGDVAGAETSQGEFLPADLVIAGIGVQPNDELASRSGLAVSQGICVDEFLRTSDAAISAIGDCARFIADYAAEPIRIESVQNAGDQARCVAARLAGRASPYRKVPWFWSDQGSNRLQIAGLSAPSDDGVVRGDLATGKFSVYRFRGPVLTAVESINRPADHMTARKLLADPGCITPAQAADPAFDLANAFSSNPSPAKEAVT